MSLNKWGRLNNKKMVFYGKENPFYDLLKWELVYKSLSLLQNIFPLLIDWLIGKCLDPFSACYLTHAYLKFVILLVLSPISEIIYSHECTNIYRYLVTVTLGSSSFPWWGWLSGQLACLYINLPYGSICCFFIALLFYPRILLLMPCVIIR